MCHTCNSRRRAITRVAAVRTQKRRRTRNATCEYSYQTRLGRYDCGRVQPRITIRTKHYIFLRAKLHRKYGVKQLAGSIAERRAMIWLRCVHLMLSVRLASPTETNMSISCQDHANGHTGTMLRQSPSNVFYFAMRVSYHTSVRAVTQQSNLTQNS